ncbi:MAG: PIN domain-containing protein [Selenomonadaceae bacterium]|nr:PIN domain-containing protein [Selenomonadaceae bacterium]MBP3721893.1 PIN domain-containing protein [Selenomonadaceae bacterium]
MKVVCDTNIFIDVILKQYPFFDSSFEILKLGLEKIVELYISATSINDIYYIIASRTHDKKTAYNAIGKIFEMATICPVTERDIKTAYDRKPYDFEDCIIAVCAENIKADMIITRDEKGFSDTVLKVCTPLEFLEHYNLSL